MRIDGNRSHDRSTELVLSYYVAFNRGDIPELLALLHKDVVRDTSRGQAEIGHEAYAKYLRARQSNVQEQLRDVVVLATQDGARAAAEFVAHGEYVRTAYGLPEARGQHYVVPCGAFFKIREGKIMRVTTFYHLQDWLAQVSDG